MDLVLWRHAEAETGEPDEGRKLTAKGEKQARRMAEWLHGRLPDSARIYASPARRAQQTAAALADVAHRKIKTLDALAPGAAPEEVLEAIAWNGGKGILVVIGHQPTLGLVASRILLGRDEDWPIKKGGVVWIGHRDAHHTVEPILRAALGPDLA